MVSSVARWPVGLLPAHVVALTLRRGRCRCTPAGSADADVQRRLPSRPPAASVIRYVHTHRRSVLAVLLRVAAADRRRRVVAGAGTRPVRRHAGHRRGVARCVGRAHAHAGAVYTGGFSVTL